MAVITPGTVDRGHGGRGFIDGSKVSLVPDAESSHLKKQKATSYFGHWAKQRESTNAKAGCSNDCTRPLRFRNPLNVAFSDTNHFRRFLPALILIQITYQQTINILSLNFQTGSRFFRTSSAARLLLAPDHCQHRHQQDSGKRSFHCESRLIFTYWTSNQIRPINYIRPDTDNCRQLNWVTLDELCWY